MYMFMYMYNMYMYIYMYISFMGRLHLSCYWACLWRAHFMSWSHVYIPVRCSPKASYGLQWEDSGPLFSKIAT